MAKEYSKYQQKIIKNYYENREAIALQRAQEDEAIRQLRAQAGQCLMEERLTEALRLVEQALRLRPTDSESKTLRRDIQLETTLELARRVGCDPDPVRATCWHLKSWARQH